MRAAAAALWIAACGPSQKPPSLSGGAVVSPPVEPIELHAVVESARYYQVFAAGNVTLLDLGDKLAVGARGHVDAVTASARPLLKVAGAWPEVWASTTHGPLIGAGAEVVRHSAGGWQSVSRLKPFDEIHDLAPFGGGVLAIVEPHAEGSTVALTAFGSTVKAPVLESTPAALCKTRVVPRKLRTRANGEVFVLGRSCDDKSTLIERWSASGVHAVDAIPGEVVAFDVTDTAAFVGGFAESKPYFARFDGKAWQREEVPLTREVRSLALLADGTVLALGAADGVELSRRSADGTWSRLTVKAPPVVTFRMAATALDDVWIVARNNAGPEGKQELLLHTHRLVP